jgi:hypothetical protein
LHIEQHIFPSKPSNSQDKVHLKNYAPINDDLVAVVNWRGRFCSKSKNYLVVAQSVRFLGLIGMLVDNELRARLGRVFDLPMFFGLDLGSNLANLKINEIYALGKPSGYAKINRISQIAGLLFRRRIIGRLKKSER